MISKSVWSPFLSTSLSYFEWYKNKKFKNFQRHWQVNPIPRGVDSSLLFVPCFFLFSFLFCIFFFYYCFVSTSGGPHVQEVSLLSSLFYSRKTGSWKMRDSMELTKWIILRISAYDICSNNMYLFLSVIAQLMFA